MINRTKNEKSKKRINQILANASNKVENKTKFEIYICMKQNEN